MVNVKRYSHLIVKIIAYFCGYYYKMILNEI